jgi:CHAT domain-containing protein/tetratricopeptide (TPR) repeat protein
MAIRGACACAFLFFVCVSESVASDIEAGSSLRESQIRETGEVCASGDSNRAALALRNLLADLEAELSAKSSVLQIVRLNLAHAERALGRTTEAKALEKQALSVETASPEPHPELASALSALRACSRLRAKRVKDPTSSGLPELIEADVATQISAVRRLYAKGQYVDARMVVERVMANSVDEHSLQISVTAKEMLALILLGLGDRDAALVAAREVVAAARRFGVSRPQIRMARLLVQAGDLEAAHTSLAALEDTELSQGERAEFEEARGEFALRLGGPREAIDHLQRALSMHREQYGLEHVSTAAVLHLVGEAYRLAGDRPAATNAYGEALRLRKKILGIDHAEYARTLNALGVLSADFGDWPGADEFFAGAAGIFKRSLGAAHPETIMVSANRALASWGAEHSDAAARAYTRAVEVLAESYGRSHPDVTYALRNLALIELDRGRPEQASILLSQVLDSQRRALGPNHPEVAATYLARGRMLSSQGNFEAAGAEFVQAVSILRDAYGEEHPLVARARVSLSRNAAIRGLSDLAWNEAREASRVLALHVKRSFGALPERQRGLLARDVRGIVGALLSAPESDPNQLYRSLIPHRDAVLRSAVGNRAAARLGNPELRETLSKLPVLRARYVAAVLGEAPGLAERAKRLSREIEGLEAIVALGGGEESATDPDQVLRSTCARLPADAALIEFVAYDRSSAADRGSTTPAYAALVLNGESCTVRHVDLGVAEPIDRAAESFSMRMREQHLDAPTARAALGESILAPLMEALRGKTRWIVIPDGALWGVPIGVLPDPERSDRFVLERVTVGYLTSIFELDDANVAAHEVTLDGALLFGAPDFGPASKDGGPTVLTADGPCRLTPFSPLPATSIELQEISGQLEHARVITGKDATKQALVEALSSKPIVLHLATHAYFAGGGGCEGQKLQPGWREGAGPIDPNPLLLSGIAFAGANASTQIDGESIGAGGILTAYEAAGLDLSQTRLVVLSACDTGTGLQRRGQEIMGLRWGFRAAGARALVTSLWRSNDVSTRKLMSDFYLALAANDSSEDLFRGADALRAAQLVRISADRRLGVARPVLWSNFVFSGVF